MKIGECTGYEDTAWMISSCGGVIILALPQRGAEFCRHGHLRWSKEAVHVTKTIHRQRRRS